MTNTPTEARLADIAAEYGSMADGLPPQLEDGPGAASAFYMSCSLGEIAAMARELAALTKRVGELEGALERKQDMLETLVSFVHRWTWVKDGNGTTDAERLDVIKHYPPIAARCLTGGEG